MDTEELREVIPGGAAAEKQYIFAVGRPADDDVIARVVREAARDATVDGHGVYVEVAVDARGVREGLAVGGEVRAGDDGGC